MNENKTEVDVGIKLDFNLWHPLSIKLDSLNSFYDPEQKILVIRLNSTASFMDLRLATDIKILQENVVTYYHEQPLMAPKFLIWTAENPGLFSLGLDLEYALNCQTCNQSKALSDYLYQCLDACYIQMHSLDIPAISISIIQGQAWGAGLAFGLLSDIVICDTDTTFGIADINENILPSFTSFFVLSRIRDNNTMYELLNSLSHASINELKKAWIIDYVIDNNLAEVMNEIIPKINTKFYTYLSAIKQKKKIKKIDTQDVNEFAELWLLAINNLSDDARQKLTLLVNHQNKIKTDLTPKGN